MIRQNKKAQMTRSPFVLLLFFILFYVPCLAAIAGADIYIIQQWFKISKDTGALTDTIISQRILTAMSMQDGLRTYAGTINFDKLELNKMFTEEKLGIMAEYKGQKKYYNKDWYELAFPLVPAKFEGNSYTYFVTENGNPGRIKINIVREEQ